MITNNSLDSILIVSRCEQLTSQLAQKKILMLKVRKQ